MDLLRPKLTQLLRLAAVSVAILMLVTLSSEAVRKRFSFIKQAELDRKGDEAIASLISSTADSDLKRILFLKYAVSPNFVNNRKYIQRFVPRRDLVFNVALLLQQELGIFYSGQKSIGQEEFRQAFNDKIVAPCQQFHSKLGDWWAESSKGRYAYNEQFEWLIAENICRVILKSIETDEFVLQLQDRVEYSLNHELDLLCNNPSEIIAAEVNSIMQTVEPVDVARLNLLQYCIKMFWGRRPARQDSLKRCRPISFGALAVGIATFLKIETGHPESAQEQAVVEQLIEEKLIKPCESIHAQLAKMKGGHDHYWVPIERVCSGFAKVVKYGKLNQLFDKVYVDYVRQLKVDQSNWKRKWVENKQLLRYYI